MAADVFLPKGFVVTVFPSEPTDESRGETFLGFFTTDERLVFLFILASMLGSPWLVLEPPPGDVNPLEAPARSLVERFLLAGRTPSWSTSSPRWNSFDSSLSFFGCCLFP